MLECPMCGQIHQIIRKDDSNSNQEEISLQNMLTLGRNATNNAQKAAGTTQQLVNQGLQLAGVGRAAAGAATGNWVSVAAAVAAAAVTIGDWAVNAYQIKKQQEIEKEERQRIELNLCEQCWKVVRLSESL